MFLDRAVFELFGAFAGLLVGALVWIVPRIGPGSVWLGCYLVAHAFVAAGLTYDRALAQDPIFLASNYAYYLTILVSPTAYLCAFTILGAKNREYFKRWRWPAVALSLVGPAILAVVLVRALLRDVAGQMSAPMEGFLVPAEAGGQGGLYYWGALYLLGIAVCVLASLERLLRAAQEHVLWQVKFLILGLGIECIFKLYIGSRIVLYTTLPLDVFQFYPYVLLLSSLLILVSWARGSGEIRVVVSQGLVYSSFTLLTVGIYLIGTGLLARWLGRLVSAQLEFQAFFVVVAMVLLAAVLLSRTFRYKLRRWIRMNIFAGKYDYRTFWLEATETIRASDPLEKSAANLMKLVRRSLGALKVGIWLRVKKEDLFRRVASDDARLIGPAEIEGILEELGRLDEPISPDELEIAREGADRGAILSLMNEIGASLCVPLRSGADIIGLLAIGGDESGHGYGLEDREFLKVLAAHAAGELHVNDLLKAQVEAKEAEAFRYFSTFLLHDLKNFSSTLSLIAKNASSHTGNPKFQKDAFESVHETAEKMKRLCNSLNVFSTSLAGKRALENLNRIVHDVAREMESSVGGRLELDLEEVPVTLLDAEAVSRMLQNLIMNSIEATDPEKGSIVVRTRSDDRSVKLRVEDNGVGISRDFLENELFFPFHTTKSEGLGIGLFQTKKIVAAHGGSIHVESEEGKGTAVRVFFPLRRSEREEPTA